MACEVFIDHLVVHSLTRWAQITQTALQAQSYKALQELITACSLSFCLSQLDIVNDSDIPASPSKQTHGADDEICLKYSEK